MQLANDFNNYFISTMSNSADLQAQAPTVSSSSSDEFSLEVIDEDLCSDLIAMLKPTKSLGPDNIPAYILRKCSNSIAKPLANIVYSSISLGVVPSVWKSAWVKPLHKGHSKNVISNYRPISLLPTCSKVLETAVHFQLRKFLNSKSLLYPLQSGFRANHSTSTMLSHATNLWYSALDKGMFVGAIFLDISKAFDTVNHAAFLGKLGNLGVNSIAYKWFHSYLMKRQQSTIVDNFISNNLIIQ